MDMKQQKLIAAPKILSFLFGSKRGPFPSQYQMGVVLIAKSAVIEQQVTGTRLNIAAKCAGLPSVFTHALKNIIPSSIISSTIHVITINFLICSYMSYHYHNYLSAPKGAFRDNKLSKDESSYLLPVCLYPFLSLKVEVGTARPV